MSCVNAGCLALLDDISRRWDRRLVGGHLGPGDSPSEPGDDAQFVLVLGPLILVEGSRQSIGWVFSAIGLMFLSAAILDGLLLVDLRLRSYWGCPMARLDRSDRNAGLMVPDRAGSHPTLGVAAVGRLRPPSTDRVHLHLHRAGLYRWLRIRWLCGLGYEPDWHSRVPNPEYGVAGRAIFAFYPIFMAERSCRCSCGTEGRDHRATPIEMVPLLHAPSLRPWAPRSFSRPLESASQAVPGRRLDLVVDPRHPDCRRLAILRYRLAMRSSGSFPGRVSYAIVIALLGAVYAVGLTGLTSSSIPTHRWPLPPPPWRGGDVQPAAQTGSGLRRSPLQPE